MTGNVEECGRPSWMSEDEYASWERGDKVQIGDYWIVPKRFARPHYDKGEYYACGWDVTDGKITNLVPGAGFARTRATAEMIIGALMASKGDADVFHGLMMMFRAKEKGA